jgi:FMN phosphatase YigB (HAD superfamily)
MTEPDEALLWARERAKRRVSFWPPNPQQAIALRVEIDAGKHDAELSDEARAYRAGQAASAERIKALEEAGDLLAWLAEHPEIELSWGDVGDVSECLWRVHVRHGGINDREWRLVDVGHTPTEALTNARALLKEADQ